MILFGQEKALIMYGILMITGIVMLVYMKVIRWLKLYRSQYKNEYEKLED